MCSVVSIYLGVAGLMLSITVTGAARLPSQGMGLASVPALILGYAFLTFVRGRRRA